MNLNTYYVDFKSLQYPTRNRKFRHIKPIKTPYISKTRQSESILASDESIFKYTFITFENERKTT